MDTTFCYSFHKEKQRLYDATYSSNEFCYTVFSSKKSINLILQAQKDENERFLEIVRTTDQCVLITANSNAACDEITERLLHLFNSEEIFRLYAKTFNASKVSSTFRPMSNLEQNEFPMPSLQYMYQFRVVVCILLTSSIEKPISPIPYFLTCFDLG